MGSRTVVGPWLSEIMVVPVQARQAICYIASQDSENEGDLEMHGCMSCRWTYTCVRLGYAGREARSTGIMAKWTAKNVTVDKNVGYICRQSG